jgi:hypothetical protein
MKSFNALQLPLGLLLLLFSFACGNNADTTANENTNGDTTTNTTTTSTTTANDRNTNQSTIVTTPQHVMIARHKVKNFNQWKTSYDMHDSMRLANGLRNYVVGRGMTDTNMVLVAVKADDMAKAKAFAKDPSLKQAMQRGGVVGTPTFNFITMTFQDTAQITTDIRSMVMLKIKEWNSWRQSFESGKQERMNNGLIDRTYGHDADDSTKAMVVVAVQDTAKARVYWSSDQLKQRRTQGGVVGEPQRFIFRVIQRY